MPRSYVKEKLTCSEHDSVSREFLGEYNPFGPSSWPSGVPNQFSHHEWESKSQKGGGYEDLYKISNLSFNTLPLWETAFPSSVFPHHHLTPTVFLLLCLTPVNCSFSPALSSAIHSYFLSQKNTFFSSFQLLLGLSLKEKKLSHFCYFIPK